MSNQIIAISWSHYQTPLKFREKLALSQKEIQQYLHLLLARNHILELAALSTCNRIEFYILAENRVLALTTIKHFYSNILKRNIPWHQSDPEIYINIVAVQHLFRVAVGMESMVMGESQILSQVKLASKILRKSQPNADVLNLIFNDAIHSAETARNDFPLYSGPTSISELAVVTAKKIFNNLEQRKVLIMGAGETAKLTACYFKESGVNEIIIANRSEKRGRALAENTSTNFINIGHVDESFHLFDVIVTATHSKNHLIERYQIENIMKEKKHTLLLLDISMPRNMDPTIHDINNVLLYNLDHLNAIALQNIKKNKQSLAKVEMMIQYHSRKFIDWFKLKKNQESKMVFV